MLTVLGAALTLNALFDVWKLYTLNQGRKSWGGGEIRWYMEAGPAFKSLVLSAGAAIICFLV